MYICWRPRSGAWNRAHDVRAGAKVCMFFVFVLGTDRDTLQHAYRDLFNQHLDKAVVHAIRTALNQELVLGREDFKDKTETLLQRQV